MGFCADILPVLNTLFGEVEYSIRRDSGGQISGPTFMQNFTPGAGFIQLAAKFVPAASSQHKLSSQTRSGHMK